MCHKLVLGITVLARFGFGGSLDHLTCIPAALEQTLTLKEKFFRQVHDNSHNLAVMTRFRVPTIAEMIRQGHNQNTLSETLEDPRVLQVMAVNQRILDQQCEDQISSH